MAQRRRWHSVRRNGPGRMRIRIAAMLLADCGITVDPFDIHCNSSPSDRWLDMCRWCVDGLFTGQEFPGGFVHVCSWSRMGDIIKAGRLEVVDDDHHHFEVCEGSSTKK